MDPAQASCAVQRANCLDFVRARSVDGWHALDERFDDEGFSGATVERPAFERLLVRILAGEVDRVVVHRLDRLSRRLADWARLATLFREHAVELSIAAGNVCTDDGAIARMQMNALATFAEWERDLIAERTADGRASRRAEGRRIAGREPIGYAADPRTKQLVVLEPDAEVVRWLFRETAAGLTTSKLVAMANRRRLATKSHRAGTWSPREVRRILRNPIYVGRLVDGRPGIHQGLVDADLWERVQSVIDSRSTREPTKALTLDPRFDPFILRGLLACGGCQRPMTTSMSTKLTPKSAKTAPRYYRCRSPGCGGQVASREVEALAFRAISTAPGDWPEDVKSCMRTYTGAWPYLWPVNQRRAMAALFESMTWNGRTASLEVRLSDAIVHASS